MIDWMVQVFRVLKVSSAHTFFLSVSLMDRYFAAQAERQVRVSKHELHEIGLVTILLSSKFEDVIPIRMGQILRDAGHNKFSKE